MHTDTDTQSCHVVVLRTLTSCLDYWRALCTSTTKKVLFAWTAQDTGFPSSPSSLLLTIFIVEPPKRTSCSHHTALEPRPSKHISTLLCPNLSPHVPVCSSLVSLLLLDSSCTAVFIRVPSLSWEEQKGHQHLSPRCHGAQYCEKYLGQLKPCCCKNSGWKYFCYCCWQTWDSASIFLHSHPLFLLRLLNNKGFFVFCFFLCRP